MERRNSSWLRESFDGMCDTIKTQKGDSLLDSQVLFEATKRHAIPSNALLTTNTSFNF